MNMKKATLVAAVSAAIGMGAVGEASANVYAGSSLDINSLSIQLFDANNDPITGVSPRYTFNVEDSATLNGATDANAAGCGSFGTPCSATSPVLTVPAANAPSSSITRADSNYSLFGPGSGTYSNSNAEISTSELVTGTPTSTKQVAESEVANTGQGQASTNIQSNTTFTLSFTLANGLVSPATLILDFSANPEMQALVNQLTGLGLAQSNMTASFGLQQLSGGSGEVSWSPQGTAANNCDASGGLACTETADSEDLNLTLGVGPDNSSQSHSLGTGASTFGLNVSGLTAGNWTLTLAALTSVNVTAVPEPGVLALLGTGLAVSGFAGAARRRKKASRS